MPIEFSCLACRRLLRVPDGTSGSKTKCPACGAVLDIPEVIPDAFSDAAPPSPAMEQPGPFQWEGVSDAPSGLPPVPPWSDTSAHGAPFASGYPGSKYPGSKYPASGYSAETDYYRRGAPSETGNPYQAPFGDEPVMRQAAAGVRGVPVTLGELFSRPLTILSARFGLICGVVFVAMLVETGLVFLLAIAVGAGIAALFGGELHLGATMSANLVGQLMGLTIQSLVSPGRTRALMDIARGRPTGVGTVFSCGHLFNRALAILLIGWAVQMMTAGIPAQFIQVLSESQSTVPEDMLPWLLGCLAWMMVGMVPLIMFLLIYGFALPALVDKNGTVSDSFRISHRITAGNRLVLFLAWLLIMLGGGAVGMVCAIVFALLIGLSLAVLPLLVIPVVLAAACLVMVLVAAIHVFVVAAYLSMSGQRMAYCY